MKQKNLTRKKVEKFHSLGFSHREISRLVEISKTRVSTILKNLKSIYKTSIDKSKQSVLADKVILQSIISMRAEGKSIRTIAYLLNIPKTRVWLILKRYSSGEN